MPPRVWGVIPAGGVGKRMGGTIPKQYLSLLGAALIQRTLERIGAVPAVNALVVGIAKQDSFWGALAFEHPKLSAVVDAGAERMDTVANCLTNISKMGGDKDWALVHDAVRPCVRIEDVERLIAAVNTRDGGILAVPLSDTIKRGGRQDKAGKSQIDATVSRQGLWRAMTPQLFRVDDLLNAIQQAKREGKDITDDASAMEAAGFKPSLISCSPDNIKITLPQELAFAEMILNAQQGKVKSYA